MKKKIILIIILFNIFFLVNVSAETITYEATYELENVKEIIAEPTFNIMLQESDTSILLKTDLSGNILLSKTLENLTNASIIKWQDTYLIVGRQNNNLLLRKVDENLRILNTLETTIIIPNCQINLYADKEKVYILFINKGALASSTVYELDEYFNLKESTFSAIKNIKEITKKDYPLFEENMLVEGEKIYTYASSTYKDDKTIRVGHVSDEAVLTIKQEESKLNIVEPNYKEFVYTTILNDSILVLATKEGESALLLYNIEGEKQEEYKINGKIIPSSIIKKGQNKLYITTEESIVTYSYETKLFKEENIYGTLSLEGEIIPFNKIKYTILPNSGYQVKGIVLKNDQGDILESKDEYFIMPNTNAYLSVLYEETITNPNTADPILLLIGCILLTLGIIRKLYKKYKWLKN